MSKLSRKFPQIEESSRLQYEADGKSLLMTVNKHIDLLSIKLFDNQTPAARVIQSTPTTVPSSAQEFNNGDSIIAKAKVKYTTLNTMALTAKQDAEEDGVYLDTASDDKISRLVHKISKYEKLRDTINSTYNDYVEFTAVFKPEEEEFDLDKLTSAVTDASNEINTLIKSIETEDEERGLATLMPRKVEKMKWPIFSGKPGENFLKFKENFLKVAKQNMTSRADQLTKLRENLKDFPLTLVPDTMESVDAAFTGLSSTYGDPLKLVNFELKKLDKLSFIPNCEDSSYTVCTRQQAEWLLQLEIILVELIKMGSDEEATTDLSRSVFGPQTTCIVLSKFPPVLKHQLISTAKASPEKERLQSYLDKIKEWAQQALELEKYESEPKVSTKKPIQHLNLKDPQVNVFDPPRPLPNCIVCEELQKKRQVPQLLHISGHPTGCPMFIEMNLVNRDKMASALKLCKSCLRTNGTGHEKACLVNKLKNKKNKSGKTKYEFTCRDQYCFRHMWLCIKHKSVNHDSMEKKAGDLELKYGWKLIHFLGCSSSSPTVQSSQSGAPVISQATAETPPVVHSKTLKAAENRLKKKSVGRNSSIEIVPIPDGEAIFMFQPLRGKTKPVNAFYDSGCSNACLRSGVPGTQLHGQRLATGPFNVTGVNGVCIQARDEWLVHLDRVDGRKQLLRAVTLDTITGESPVFNVEKATEEIKADKPDDFMLQNLCVPSCVGGEVDILIGTLYNLIFPKPIHHLPNGLTIYSCILASHDSSINATIGGPHTSFTLLSDAMGGSANLLAHFVNGLKAFKQWGPPSIANNPITLEENKMASLLNGAEGDPIFKDLVSVDNAEDYINELLKSDIESPDGLSLQRLITTAESSIMLSVCECRRLCNIINPCTSTQPLNASNHQSFFTDMEKITPMSKLKILEDGGLSIEYRCVKCRDCADCRNAEETEKISLREEAEMHMIRESVRLDLPNKKIICSLPLRGPEQDFLTTNRDRALQILDQQCRKYQKDDEIKAVAVKAFSKLLDNGHAILMDDLDVETKGQFIHKDPQYFIPWVAI